MCSFNIQQCQRTGSYQKKFNIVIYANHLLRAAYPAMTNTALSILKNGRSKESDKKMISIKEILKLIPGTS